MRLSDLRVVDLRKIATSEKLQGRSKHTRKQDLVLFIEKNVNKARIKKYLKRYPRSLRSPKKKKRKTSHIPLELQLEARGAEDVRDVARNFNLDDNMIKQDLIKTIIANVNSDELERYIWHKPILQSYKSRMNKLEKKFVRNLRNCKSCGRINKQKFPCSKKRTVFWNFDDMKEWCDMKRKRMTGNRKYRKRIARWATEDWANDPSYIDQITKAKTKKRVSFDTK